MIDLALQPPKLYLGKAPWPLESPSDELLLYGLELVIGKMMVPLAQVNSVPDTAAGTVCLATSLSYSKQHGAGP